MKIKHGQFKSPLIYKMLTLLSDKLAQEIALTDYAIWKKIIHAPTKYEGKQTQYMPRHCVKYMHISVRLRGKKSVPLPTHCW